MVFRLARAERDAWVSWPAGVAALMAAELSAACGGEGNQNSTIELAIEPEVDGAGGARRALVRSEPRY